jgi:protein-tyrosine phosphatase
MPFLERCCRTSPESERVMRANVFWIAGPWPGKSGILLRPRGGDWLGDETRAWREAGVDVVVSLLEPEEEALLVLEGEAAAAAASGVEFRPFPVPDRGVLASRESVAQLAGGIVHALETGRNVAVHCRQGIGRSALIVGGVLVAAGKDPNTALKTIEQSRGLEVPETDEQRQWLRDFASWLASTQGAQPAAAADERRGPGRSGSKRP